MPDPNLEKSKQLIALAEKCYNETDSEKRGVVEEKIDKLVWSVFNVSQLAESTG